MELGTDIVSVNVTDNVEVLVAMDGRTFCFDEAVWCTEVLDALINMNFLLTIVCLPKIP